MLNELGVVALAPKRLSEDAAEADGTAEAEAAEVAADAAIQNRDDFAKATMVVDV